MNLRVNGFLEIRAKAPESNEISSNPENLFNNADVQEFWNSLSDSQKEELLLIKQTNIIESILQALNEFNLIAGSNGKIKEQDALKQTFAFNRLGKPTIAVTIIRFDHLASLEEQIPDQNYFFSVVILLIEQLETNSEARKSKSVDDYPSIHEQELLEYVGNIELLEKHRAVLKIKYNKLDRIFKTFSGVYSNFCQGNKKIVSEDQYNKVFLANKLSDTLVNELQVNEKTNGKQEAEYLAKPKRMLKSVVLMFENNILAAYIKESQAQAQAQTQMQTQPQSNDNYENANPQMYYQHSQGYHFHAMQGYNLYPHHGFASSLLNNIQQKPMGVFPPFEFMEGGGITGNFGGVGYHQTNQLFEVWPGVFFGTLVFDLTGSELEEEAYSQEIRPQNQGVRRFSDENRSQTEIFASRSTAAKRNLTYQGGNYNQRSYTETNDALQQLLGVSPFMNRTQLQQQPQQQTHSRPQSVSQGQNQSGQTLAVPLLETVIKLPGLNKSTIPLNTDFDMQAKGIHRPQMGISVSYKSNGGYLNQEAQVPKNIEQTYYNDDNKQEELEFATVASNDSSTKENDRDSLSDSYKFKRTQHPGGVPKKKLRLKQGDNNDFHANTSHHTDWGQLTGGSTSDKQLFDFTQPGDSTANPTSGLADSKETPKIPSKDNIQ